MELLRTIDSTIRWSIGPLRGTYAQPDLEAASERAEAAGSSLAAVCQLSKAWSFSLASNHPQYELADFGFAIKEFADHRGIERLIYIESIDQNKALTVSVTADAIIDSVDAIDQVPDVIRRLQRSQKESFTFIIAASALLNEQLELFNNLHAEALAKPLSMELAPHDFRFKALDEALQIKNPAWFWPVVSILSAGVIAGIYLALKPEPPPPPPQNPHIARVEQTTRQSISVLTRANQIIDALRQFKAVVGWQLVGINQGKNSLAFRMKPVTGALVSELELFAKRYGFSMLREPNAADSTVLLVKEPVNTINTQDTRLFEVEQVITFITDAVALYIPHSQLTIIRATPDSSREWGTVELAVELKEANYRYLNTLGAILIGLPVSLGGGPAEIAVGDLTVSGENVTGSIKLVVYGQGKTWQ